MIHFEWDELKNRINKAKHGISFEEAATVFYDTNNHPYYLRKEGHQAREGSI